MSNISGTSRSPRVLRHMKLYNEAVAASNITVNDYQVAFDPDANWLKFHAGISRHALYSRHDAAIARLLLDMRDMTVINSGDAWTTFSNSHF